MSHLIRAGYQILCGPVLLLEKLWSADFDDISRQRFHLDLR